MNSHPQLLVQKQSLAGGVECRVTLNSSANRNALSVPLMQALIDQIDQCDAECLTLVGQPQAFCAGLDFQIFLSNTRRKIQDGISLMLQLYQRLASFPGRTRTLINGPAVGGGVGLALLADQVLCTPQAQLRVPEGDLIYGAEIIRPIVEGRSPRCPWPFRLNAIQAEKQHLVTIATKELLMTSLPEQCDRTQLLAWLQQCEQKATEFLHGDQLPRFIDAIESRLRWGNLSN